jgi:pimeloyl-ACP methyl ester carboxylesterase
MERGYQKSKNGQVHFITSGTTGPRIVLLHESPLSNRVFENCIPNLSEWSQVFAPDTPGYGNSDPLTKDSALDEYAKVVGQAIKNWAGNQKVLICGTHTGASLAIEVANQFNDLAVGLFLIGVPVYSEEQRADRIANWCPDIKIEESGQHLQWAWERYVKIWPSAPLAARNLAVIEMLRVSNRYNWGYLQAFMYDVEKSIRLVNTPIRIAAAEHEFLFTGSKKLADELSVKFVTFENLDGQVPLRNPKMFSDALKSFVQSINGDSNG